MGKRKTRFEIGKDEYNKLVELKNTSTKEFYRAIEDLAYLTLCPPNAYGCETPMSVYEEDGKYFASWMYWDSCD